MNHSPVVLLVSLLSASPTLSLAQQQPAGDETVAGGVDTVTAVGTRTERSLRDVAATVTVKSAEELERELARDIADLVRFEPGVSVSGTGNRFGLSGFTIRGVGGNRVLTLVDGIRVPEEFSFGPFLSARRDFVDIDSLQRAEIARGPISSLYGSDALGGVVAFTTKRPQDYLDADNRLFAGFKGGYASADESAVGTLTAAAGGDRLSGLLVYTRRDGSETENQGSIGGTGPTRELADPLSFESDNVTAKIAFSPNDAHTFTAGFGYFQNDTESQILSDYGIDIFGTTVDSRDAVDERNRNRLSLGYEYAGDSGFVDQVQATVYRQESATEQLTTEQRTTGGGGSQSRIRRSTFDQEIEGAFLQFGKSVELGGSRHLLTFGADYYTTASEGLRDGVSFDADGAVIPPSPFAPILPTRDFPLTDVDQFAVFLQDEMSFLDGRLLLSPGLRYDRFEADTAADEIYLSGNPGSPLPEDYDDSEVTGKIGAVFAVSDAVSVYGQYSEGFRAPPYDDVNVGFTNFLGGYKTIANPDLKSERSDGVELGLRLQNEHGNLNLAVFHNDYEDFIASFVIAPEFLPFGGVDPADNLLTFQSINRDNVEISGAELSGGLSLASLSETLSNLSLRFAVAYADGEDEDSGEPINSIEPLTGVLGLRYSTPDDRWGTELIWTIIDGKDENDIDAADPRIATSGYGILDLFAHWSVTDKVRLDLGLFNIGDRSYIRWVDTVAIGNDTPARFTQPGFNVAATLRVEI